MRKIAGNRETISNPSALMVVMDSKKSMGMNVSGTTGSRLQQSLRIGPALESLFLPQAQAGLAPWSRPRLTVFSNGVSKRMEPEHIDRDISFVSGDERLDRLVDNAAEHLAARSKIDMGARAVNRLLWSIWFMLLPLIWPSSDWIGLVILSQAFFVAAKLIQPNLAEANSTASAATQVINMKQGEDCAQG
jgi:hypothetical protein